jgi:hypothetical protein
MRRYQVKRARPTFKTALDFSKEGSFSVDPKLHYLSDDERRLQIENVEAELFKLVKLQFPRTQNLKYTILKMHLIFEYALVQYIRCFAATPVDDKKFRFSFAQKLEIAYLLGFGANDPTLFPTVEGLNKLRNQVAHTFELDRDLVDQLIRINSEDDSCTPKNDKDRIRMLRAICAFTCGCISGEISAVYHVMTFNNRSV